MSRTLFDRLDPQHSTLLSGAGNGTRTRDPNLGKVVLYQLSYSRSARRRRLLPVRRRGNPYERLVARRVRQTHHGGEGNRTPDLLNAIQALSQLSYTPGIVPDGLAHTRQEPRRISKGSIEVK